ncbi:branched-chain amino acid transport system ATP-binding protein [Frankia sp. Hr75.2]|nr:branched-chain amino acid transport system ATP-binding protein [Frankia sp. Hr75.2]
MTTTVLKATDIGVRFGGIKAVAGVDLEVGAGQLVGLIGPNGAGKTTLVDAITGFLPCTGRVDLAGRDVTHLEPHARARLGLARTWQSVELFDDLSVRENLAVAAGRPSIGRTLRELLRNGDHTAPTVDDTLALVGVSDLGDAMPRELSAGQRTLVGVARALAGSPKIVCLDEPAAGLDTTESQLLGRQLRRIVDAGMPMLLIDHDMGFVFGSCDRVVVLDAGSVLSSGPPEVVRTDPRVISAYLGGADTGSATDPQRST